MPVGFLPGEELPNVLCSLDEDMPEEKRLRLTLRVMSGAEARQIGALLKKFAEDENLDHLHTALKIGIASWQNCEHPFTDEGIDLALTVHSQVQLARELPLLGYLAEVEKKVSRSRARLEAARSAKHAAAAAKTSPPQTVAP